MGPMNDDKDPPNVVRMYNTPPAPRPHRADPDYYPTAPRKTVKLEVTATGRLKWGPLPVGEFELVPITHPWRRVTWPEGKITSVRDLEYAELERMEDIYAETFLRTVCVRPIGEVFWRMVTLRGCP